MKFWAGVFFAFTIWLVLAKTEDPTSDDDPDMDVKKVYKVMWSIVRLKSKFSWPRDAGYMLIIQLHQISSRSCYCISCQRLDSRSQR